jgi:hypothetical protein
MGTVEERYWRQLDMSPRRRKIAVTRSKKIALLCSLMLSVLTGCASSENAPCCRTSASEVIVPKDIVKSKPAELITKSPVIIRAQVVLLRQSAIVTELSGEVLLSGRHDAYRQAIASGATIHGSDFIEVTEGSSITLRVVDKELRLTSKDGTWFKFEQQ